MVKFKDIKVGTKVELMDGTTFEVARVEARTIPFGVTPNGEGAAVYDVEGEGRLYDNLSDMTCSFAPENNIKKIIK